MILCVTPNAALDRTLVVSKLQPGVVARPTQTLVVAGGKGFNVARAVQTLGGSATCAGFLGGHTGRLVADLAETEGLRGRYTWRQAETRTCTIVVDEATGQVLEIYEPGPPLAPSDWSRLVEDVRQAAQPAAVVCLSGSLPPGCPSPAPADLIEAIRSTGKPVWVDTTGPALQAAVETGPAGIKINLAEASSLLGAQLASPEQAAWGARALVSRGVGTAVISMGSAGAVLANGAGCWRVTLPPLPAVSAVGSGDSFLAGLLLSLAAGLAAPPALARAAAVGAANTLAPGGGRFRLSEVEAILAQSSCWEWSDRRWVQ